MAYFLGQSVVSYVCGCGILKPITKIYFCRHCLKIRCAYCVCHEVDSHYCVNCLENIPSSEARLRKHKCANCFNCPCCFHTLSTRATNVPLPQKADDEKKDVKPVTRKMYYFACFSCRWTSRDVGIPDQTVASGAWPERENVHANRITALQEYFSNITLRDKIAKQEMLKKKHNARGKFTTLTDKTGLTAALLRKQVGLPDLSLPSNSLSSSNRPTITPAVALEDVDDFPEDIFTKPVNLMEVTTVAQRLFQPDNQAATVSGLFPQHKILSIKQSLRCRQCEHNVIKPEYNPSSIKFKINLLACYHVPEVRLISCDSLKAGQSSQVILKLTNPTHNEMLINFLPIDFECPQPETKIDKKPGVVVEENSVLLGRQISVSLPEEPREFKNIANSVFSLPETQIALPARDDAAEYDDIVTEQEGDPGFVVWRKFNKLGTKFTVLPEADLKPGDEVIAGLTLKYTYVNTVSSFPERLRHELYAKVFVTVGKIM